MRRIILFTLAIWLLFPLPTLHPGDNGIYMKATGLYWCNSTESCLHERAHRIDWRNGKISHSEDYKHALMIYLYTSIDDPLAMDIVYLMGYPIEEIYAWVYQRANGNVPDMLKPFYPEPQTDFRSFPLMGGELYYPMYPLLSSRMLGF